MCWTLGEGGSWTNPNIVRVNGEHLEETPYPLIFNSSLQESSSHILGDVWDMEAEWAMCRTRLSLRTPDAADRYRVDRGTAASGVVDATNVWGGMGDIWEEEAPCVSLDEVLAIW